MAVAESGLARPGWLSRLAQEHLRVFFFSLGKLGRAPLATAMTALVVGIALALPAGLHVLTRNFAVVGHSWQESLQISLFLKDSVPDERGAALAQELRSGQGVARSRYISRAQSLDDFRAQSGFGEALDILKDNPLPAVIAVTPVADLGKDGTAALTARLAKLPEVELAKLDQKWLERLYAVLTIAERAVGIIGLLLAIAVMVIVANTIRLDIEARREEIEVMKLIGAPNSFIRRPFLYAGIWFGLLGGLLAWLLLALGVNSLAGPTATLAQAYGAAFALTGLGFLEGLGLVGLGVALGWWAALATVSRRLALIEPR